jgi:hypothetical protein
MNKNYKIKKRIKMQETLSLPKKFSGAKDFLIGLVI